MIIAEKVPSDFIRLRFATALSEMYSAELPEYAALVKMEKERIYTASSSSKNTPFPPLKSGQAYHGAIRLGTAEELQMIRRAFSIMGLYPVGYYDLSVAGLPVHSTAFRPISPEAIDINPFRVFTSLLRLDMIEDEGLKRKAEQVLSRRNIYSARSVELIEKAESQEGLNDEETDEFVSELLKTFRWNNEAMVSVEDYTFFDRESRLIADIVSFKGPHINHLTVGTINIDEAQCSIENSGAEAKSSIEGPPLRSCPILLRQTAFKAIEEAVSFPDAEGKYEAGSHTARFGEIEARGAALTPKGRALYDKLLAEARENKASHTNALEQAFEAFPDDWEALRVQGLAYFRYTIKTTGGARPRSGDEDLDIESLLAEGAVDAVPILYEDFLPVSAAGIFRSNLGDDTQTYQKGTDRKDEFEACLGAKVLDPFELYQAIETDSISRCLEALKSSRAA
jgi:uncharacterized glyoxalase superfamily metalloenzyme YdcJ